tara:strand:+ start:69 stop:446 length:378 start_codon:yes stop_codon:yes gene_type:complete
MYHDTYLSKLEDYDEKIVRLESQIDRTTSDVKREILEKQRSFYLNEIEKIDKTMEHTTRFIDKKMDTLETQLNTLSKEKKSFEFNIKKLKESIERRNTGEIFDMFECVTNALTALREECDSSSTP